MRYDINLWRIDDSGRWTAYAVGRTNGGEPTTRRDTQSVANPPLDFVTDWPLNSPPSYHAGEAVWDFTRIADGLLTAGEMDGEAFKGAFSVFFTALMSLPRFADSHGHIEIGSEDIISVWKRCESGDAAARLERPKVHTASEAIRAEEERLSWFTERVARVRDFIRAEGRRTGASREADRTVAALDNLCRAMFSYHGTADQPRIDAFANEAEDAVQSMAIEAAANNTKSQGKSYRKYPQDAEALALLEAAANLKVKLSKKNPNITNNEVIQALLDEPDGSETKRQKDQRLKYQFRVWYGTLKNGKRRNATATPPERLDAKTRAATWEKHYKKWGKTLSAYLLHPPTK